MSSFIIVIIKPIVQIFLQALHIRIEFLAERDLVKLLQNGLVKPLAYAVGLWWHGFGFGVVKVIDRQIELKVVLLHFATILCAAIRENA